MQGAQLITLFDKMVLDYTYLTVPSGNQTVILERALPVIPFYHLWWGIRVHALDCPNGNFLFEAHNTLPSDEDPAEFTLTTSTVLTSTITSTVAPALVVATATGAGPFLRIRMKATQGSSAGHVYGEFSMALYGRAS
jgi:hypothetical protein